MAPAKTTARMARRATSFFVMNWAMTSTEPLSSINLPNNAPSRNSGKNCARNLAAPPMKVWVQWARSGSPAVAAATSAAAGAKQSMLQPRKDSQMSRPSARRMPRAPSGKVQTCSINASMSSVERARHPRCTVRNSSAERRPSSRSMVRNSHSALSFEEAPSP